MGEEISSSLNEIKTLRKKKQGLKMLLQEEGNNVCEKIIALEFAERQIEDLKVHIEEAKNLEEGIRKQLKDKELECEKLENEVFSLRKFEKSSQ